MHAGDFIRFSLGVLLGVLVGAAITATHLLSLAGDSRSPDTAGVCECSSGSVQKFEPRALQHGSFTSHVEAARASQRGGRSLLQASSTAASSPILAEEGIAISFGAIEHESAWLSPRNITEIEIGADPEHESVKREERPWFHWLRDQLKERPKLGREESVQEECTKGGTDFLSAAAWVVLLAGIPMYFGTYHGKETTWTHCVLSFSLVIWLFWGMYMFCNVVHFQSSHWKGDKTLNLVESVYIMAQIITTVGYGDITPAFREGQMCMMVFVLFGIIVIANVLSRMGGILLHHIEGLSERARTHTLENALKRSASTTSLNEKSPEGSTSSTSLDDGTQTDTVHSSFPSNTSVLPDWRDMLSTSFRQTTIQIHLAKALALYIFFFVIGGLFFHYVEERSWLESFYMVVITSASLGFGACTPTTRRGFIFSAFWMLFACGTLGMVIARFSELMLLLERQEQMNLPSRRKKFRATCEAIQNSTESDRADRYEFTKIMLLYADVLKRSDLICLENIFDNLDPDEHSLVEIDAIKQACFGD